MKELLTTYKASKKYGLSARYLRTLLDEGRINYDKAPTSENRFVFVINEPSLQRFLKTRRKPGRPPKKA